MRHAVMLVLFALSCAPTEHASPARASAVATQASVFLETQFVAGPPVAVSRVNGMRAHELPMEPAFTFSSSGGAQVPFAQVLLRTSSPTRRS